MISVLTAVSSFQGSIQVYILMLSNKFIVEHKNPCIYIQFALKRRGFFFRKTFNENTNKLRPDQKVSDLVTQSKYDKEGFVK